MPRFFHHELLCRARIDLGLTQEQAAAAAGVDVRTYRRYESGEVNDPARGFSIRHASRRKILGLLARELGLAEDDLLVARSAEPGPVATEAQATPDPGVRGAPAPAPGFMVRHAHALPRARHFVGRAELVDRLVAWHRDGAARGGVIAIVALGGAGKTSVVERFLDRIGDGPHPGGVLVYSFYDEPRIEVFFEQALATFAPDSKALPGERADALIEALRRGPHLLVLDGIEIVQGTGAPGSTFGRIEDAALRRLLIGVARGLGTARVLVTSRFPLSDLAAWEGAGLATIELESLARAEGVELLGRWGLRGSARDLAPLVDRVGRHALSVAMMGSYAGAFLGGDPARARAIDLEPAARDDVAARRLLSVLSAYAGALPDTERDLVARLSLFPAGATIDALLAIAEAGGTVGGATSTLDRAGIQRSLSRLSRLGLVFDARGGERWATHPFLREYFRSILGVPAAEVHAVTRDALAARLDIHRVGVTSDLLDAYEELCAHTLASGRADDAWGIYLRSLGGFTHLGLRQGEMRRGARILTGFLEGGDPARPVPALAKRTRPRLAYDLGLYAGALGDLALACRCYRAHNDAVRAAGTIEPLATGLRTLAYTERLRGSLADALALADAALDVSSGAGSRADVVRALALRGSILHDLGRTRQAIEAFEEVHALGDVPFARRGLWEAEHLLDVGRVGDARTLTERNVEVCRELGWEGHVAHCETVLGHAALAGDPRDIDAAQRHLAAARRWTAATGEVEVVLRCAELQIAIAAAEERWTDAEAALAEGLDLAENMGFGWFQARFGKLRSTIVPPAESRRGRAR